MKKTVFLFVLICAIALIVSSQAFTYFVYGFAQPFYDLSPSEMVLRAKFYTGFSTSTEERAYNIKLASSKINGYFLEVGEEFSFNKTVGNRTASNGFKEAKIIVDGKFTEGVGGGVCQVSSTLYNAVILAGLEVKEYHPHTLSVGYVAPSFDAMVSYGYADLRFVNNTKNPIWIKTFIKDGSYLYAEIYGESSEYSFVRESCVTGKISPPSPDVIVDTDDIYGLSVGEEKFISYAKEGMTSEGYLLKYKNGKLVSRTLIRKDKYLPITAVIVKSAKEQSEEDILESTGF